MKTSNIPVDGNSAVYINYCAVGLNIDYTLRCAVLTPLDLLFVKTLTNAL